jgi:hypothetical protein
MAVAVTIDSIIPHDSGAGIDKTQSALIVEGSLTLSGNYGGSSPAHGDAVDFADARVTSSSIPRRVEIFQYKAAGVMPASYSFLYAYGSDQTDGELTVISLTTGLEFTQGSAYPGELTAANAGIRFRATFPLFI